jgi:uncharacterized membrane protein YgcG
MGGGRTEPRFSTRLARIGRPAPVGAQVVRTSELAPEETESLQEDLSVMNHIIDRAVAESVGAASAGRTVMGIEYFPPGGQNQRTLYIEGYGALFFVNVNFPLLGPQEKANEAGAPAPADSAWEQAKQELYGRESDLAPAQPSVENYSQQKVASLTRALAKALRNARNIRNLKPDEVLTVCITGTAMPSRHDIKVQSPASDVFAIARRDNRTTTMTISLKKSEAESLPADEAQALEKLRTTTYQSNAGTPNSSGVRWETFGGAGGFGGGGGGGGGGFGGTGSISADVPKTTF